MADGDTDVRFRGGRQNYKWWNRRSKAEKIFAIVCILLIVACISLLIVNILTHNKLKKVEEEASSICRSKECVKAASDMIDYLNPAVNPCDDFYDFACGGYIQKNVVPEDYLKTGVIFNQQDDIYVELKQLVEPPVSTDDSEVTVATKNLYASCMNSTLEDGSREVFRQLLERVGRWPIADTKWNEEDADPERLLAILFVHGVTPFIKASVEDGVENNTNYVFKVETGTLILDDNFYLDTSNAEYQKAIQAYRKMIVATARILEAQELTIQKDVEDIMTFETEYARISAENKKLLRGRYASINAAEFEENRYTLAEVEEALPEVKWGHFLDKVFDYFRLHVEKNNLRMAVQNVKHFQNLTVLLKQTTPRTLANYLMWRFVFKMMPYLDEHFRRLYQDFRKIVKNGFGYGQMYSSRWRECISIAIETFQLPLTSMYVVGNFDDAKSNEVKELIKSVKHGFLEGIHLQDWLDKESMSVLEEKLSKMKSKIGFPPIVLQPDELAKEYSGLKIRKDRFLENMLAINRHNVETQMSKLTGKTKYQEQGIAQPLTLNAYNDPFKNTIIFPLAILQPPTFIPGRPKYINYATMGFFIGHEIGHGFDTHGFSIGMLYEVPESKQPRNWFSKQVYKLFMHRAQCFVDQYFKLPIEMIDQNVDGYQTLNDNICDNAGLRNAYRAYNTYVSEHGEEPKLPGVSYSNSQVFFIKYGQVLCEKLTRAGSAMYTRDMHSPARHRVNKVLANSPEFSAAFNCPRESPMNPEEKCSIYT